MKKDQKKILAEAIIESEERVGKIQFPQRFHKYLEELFKKKNILFAGGLLIAANAFANVLNFLFSIYVGRVLTFTDFALISLMTSFYSFANMFIGSLNLTVNYQSGFLMGKFTDAAGYQFWKYVRKYSLYIGLITGILWLLFSPVLNSFFKADSLFLFISFSAIIVTVFASGVDKGFLTARLFFAQLALVVFAEPIIKIVLAVILTITGFSQYIYITIPLAFIIQFILAWLLIISRKPKDTKFTYTKKDINYFPKKFLFISLLSGLSTLSFASLDIVLAKHYLPPVDAGKYALVSLMGKTVYYLGLLATPFLIPLVSRDLGANKNATKTLYLLLLFTFILCLFGFVAFGLFGPLTAPLLLGKKAYSIIPYLNLFLFSVMCFSVSQIFAWFYQMKKIYLFPVVCFLLSILQVVLIVISHTTVWSIVIAMSFVGIANLVVMTLMHFQWRRIQLLENTITTYYERRRNEK